MNAGNCFSSLVLQDEQLPSGHWRTLADTGGQSHVAGQSTNYGSSTNLNNLNNLNNLTIP